jgi:TatD DNase family protein
MGLHPCSVKQDYAIQLKQIEMVLGQNQYYGIGEIGIDLYWDPASLPQQVEAFIIQCQWAQELELPIIIHSRDATDKVIEVLEECIRPGKGCSKQR